MDDRTWHAMSRDDQKRWDEDEVEATLRRIQGLGGDLDDWERTHLAEALAFIGMGWYSAAATAIHLANSTEKKAPGEPRHPIAVTTREIEDGLAFVRGMPARR